MAPSKKLKTVGKQVAAVHDVSSLKDARRLKKSKKKPKLVNMLGPQWSKQELERFYQGFRKYGIDWKKVATMVRNRSPDMLEALYNMNRAYLSLPEGTASVAGLIAMMTDHYNNLEGNGSDGDDVYSGISRRPPKYTKGTFHVGFPQEQNLQSRSPKKTDRCLSLLKKCYDGWQLRIPVRKRTPRVPIPSAERNYSSISSISPIKTAQRSGVSMDGDENAHGTALLLSETLQQVGSSQVSPTTNGTIDDYKQVSMGKQMGKYHGIKMDDEGLEGSFDRRGAENVDASVKLSRGEFKSEKKGKKQKDESHKHLQDIPEAYNDLNGKLNIEHLLGKLSFQATNAGVMSSSYQAQRKRSKKLVTEDESLACDALHALADLSLALAVSPTEPVESSRESANGGAITLDSAAVSDATLVKMSAGNESKKKKQKTSKIQTTEKQSQSQSKRLTEEKTLPEDVKSRNMLKECSQAFADTKNCKSARSSVVTSVINQEMVEVDADAVVSSRQHAVTDQVDLPTKRKIQRKRKRMLTTDDAKKDVALDLLRTQHNSLLPGTTPIVKDKLSRCLSSPLLRRWCGFEWFYSAIDYPWFAKKEFVEYLNHVGLGHIPRLTRVEWGVIRSSLGKPRRFSSRFLQEEREKLHQYRDSVRTHYSELRTGLREGLPTDLARPLSVSQRVIAIHPKTREFHEGSILIVYHDKCRVQFDRPELGVENVVDINCMPSNYLENIPEAMKRQKFLIDYANSSGQVTDGQSMLAYSSLNSWPGTSTLSHKVDLASTMPSQLQVDAFAFQDQPREGENKPAKQLHNSLVKEPVQIQPYLFCHKQEKSSVNFVNAFQSSAGEVQRYLDDGEDSASKVDEIVRGSREKAHTMVDAAIQAVSVLKQGEDAFARIGDALESVGEIQHPSASGLPPIPSHSRSNVMNFSSSENSTTNSSGNASSESTRQDCPTRLITSCVATLLMIEKCTDRQYPPSEVANILDNAVTNLQPCCPQNLTVYREIAKCMGKIKTQILALIPS